MTSNTSKDQPIVVVGAGLVGAMTAILLSKRGYTKITVYDARPDPRVGLSGPLPLSLPLSISLSALTLPCDVCDSCCQLKLLWLPATS
eukprot:505908-Rhodomonas_salina.2